MLLPIVPFFFATSGPALFFSTRAHFDSLEAECDGINTCYTSTSFSLQLFFCLLAAPGLLRIFCIHKVDRRFSAREMASSRQTATECFGLVPATSSVLHNSFFLLFIFLHREPKLFLLTNTLLVFLHLNFSYDSIFSIYFLLLFSLSGYTLSIMAEPCCAMLFDFCTEAYCFAFAIGVRVGFPGQFGAQPNEAAAWHYRFCLYGNGHGFSTEGLVRAK